MKDFEIINRFSSFLKINVVNINVYFCSDKLQAKEQNVSSSETST